MIRVLIADDHVLFRIGIKKILEAHEGIKVVGFAGNGMEALTACDSLMPDIVLMDIVMPECDGVQGTKMIKEKYGQIKVIILTTFNDYENVLPALKNGADGYILKDTEPEKLIMTIKSAAMGLRIIDKNTLSGLVERMEHTPEYTGKEPDNNTKTQELNLTKTELELIKLIVFGKSNKEIAPYLNITEGSVRNKVSIILKKLDLYDRVQLALYAVKNDLI